MWNCGLPWSCQTICTNNADWYLGSICIEFDWIIVNVMKYLVYLAINWQGAVYRQLTKYAYTYYYLLSWLENLASHPNDICIIFMVFAGIYLAKQQMKEISRTSTLSFHWKVSLCIMKICLVVCLVNRSNKSSVGYYQTCL